MQSLSALDTQVTASLENIRTQLAAEFAPKLTMEDAIAVLIMYMYLLNKSLVDFVCV